MIPFEQHAGVPHDLLRCVPQEISVGEYRPDPIDIGIDHARGGEQLARIELVGAFELILIDRRFEAAAQCVLHAIMELGEQRGFPRVPQARVGRSHIRCGEHVEIIEVCFVAYEPRECIDDFGIGDVLLLRRQ